MTGAALIGRIARESGRIWLDREGRLRAKGISDARLKQLRESPYLITAFLHEEIASRRWERSCRDSKWWRRPESVWSYPEQELKPFAEIVRIWVSAHLISASSCATNPRTLYRDFFGWAGLERNATAEHEFLQQLAALGYLLRDGFAEGICLAEDFVAALEYENDRRDSSGDCAIETRTAAVVTRKAEKSETVRKGAVMKCEVELQNRAKKGEATPCGKPATSFRMHGEIASVTTALCEFHAVRMEAQGYRLETLDPPEQERIA